MVTLSIIILSFNTKDLTKRCLESLVDQYKKELKRGEFEIIVVDNGSKDGTIQTIQSSKFKVIENDKNFGFAKGCNIGARAAKGKYILFLNSDTEVRDRGFVKMTDFLENNDKIGIMGGRLLNIDGSAQPSVGKFYTLFYLFLMLTGMEVFLGIRKSPDKISKVDWVSGGSMMVKKSLFDKLSGFDEKFFMYIEDMEICYRTKKLGFSTYFYPSVKVLHKELGSGNRSFAIINIYKGLLYFYKKHKSYFQYVTAKAMLIIKAKAAIIVGLLTGNSGLINTYNKAIRF